MPTRPYQWQYREPVQTQSPHYGIQADMDFRDTAFVYPVTMSKNRMNEDVECWAEKPLACRCSVQIESIDSQKHEPDKISNRFARLFTRYRGFVKWHDRVVVRGISLLIIQIEERFDNVTGQFHHTEIRGRFMDEAGSVSKDY